MSKITRIMTKDLLISYGIERDYADMVVRPCECDENCAKKEHAVCIHDLAKHGDVGAVWCNHSGNKMTVWGFNGRCIKCHNPHRCMFHAG